MSELVEQVARNLCPDERYADGDWPSYRQEAIKAIRAVIEAMAAEAERGDTVVSRRDDAINDEITDWLRAHLPSDPEAGK